MQNSWQGTANISQLSVIKDRIVVLYQNLGVTNLGYFNLANLDKINQITDLVNPKTIMRYDIATIGSQIVYQVSDSTNKSNDLYVVNIDGTNLLQLTTDGKSFYPVFYWYSSRCSSLSPRRGSTSTIARFPMT